MQKPDRGPGSVDWHKLKAEFLSTQVSLNKLRERHGLAQAYFFRKTKGWHAEKAAIQKKAIAHLKDDIVDHYAEYIKRSHKFLNNMFKHFEAALTVRQEVDEHGELKVQIPLSPDLLLDLSKSFAENLKSIRLISDKSTENKAIGVGADGDLHAALMQLINVIEDNEKTDA